MDTMVNIVGHSMNKVNKTLNCSMIIMVCMLQCIRHYHHYIIPMYSPLYLLNMSLSLPLYPLNIPTNSSYFHWMCKIRQCYVHWVYVSQTAMLKHRIRQITSGPIINYDKYNLYNNSMYQQTRTHTYIYAYISTIKKPFTKPYNRTISYEKLILPMW